MTHSASTIRRRDTFARHSLLNRSSEIHLQQCSLIMEVPVPAKPKRNAFAILPEFCSESQVCSKCMACRSTTDKSCGAVEATQSRTGRHAQASSRPASLTVRPVPRPSPQTSFRTSRSTYSAMARLEVKPGLSMPWREMNPGRGCVMEKSTEVSPRADILGRIPESIHDRISSVTPPFAHAIEKSS